jgi:hypothetical protein
MSEFERYEPDYEDSTIQFAAGDVFVMSPCDNGDWCLYDDVAPIIQRNAELTEELARLRKQKPVWWTHVENGLDVFVNMPFGLDEVALYAEPKPAQIPAELDETGEIIPLYTQPKQTEQYTHAKRPYMAHAIQYNGNAETIMQLVPSLRLDWVGGEINARIGDNIRHLKHGYWVVKGENGNVKIYDNATFNVKYTKLNSEF